MRHISIALIAALAACSENPKPPSPKPPAQFLWMTVPGSLSDAEHMGFTCQPSPDIAAFRCHLGGANVLGVGVDASLTANVKNSSATYETIDLITRQPTGWERSCHDTADVDIVMLDGSIKKTASAKPCVKDTSYELDVALVSAGWNKAVQGRHTTYTNGANGVTIKVYMHSPVFSVMRSE